MFFFFFSLEKCNFISQNCRIFEIIFPWNNGGKTQARINSRLRRCHSYLRTTQQCNNGPTNIFNDLVLLLCSNHADKFDYRPFNFFPPVFISSTRYIERDKSCVCLRKDIVFLFLSLFKLRAYIVSEAKYPCRIFEMSISRRKNDLTFTATIATSDC